MQDLEGDLKRILREGLPKVVTESQVQRDATPYYSEGENEPPMVQVVGAMTAATLMHMIMQQLPVDKVLSKHHAEDFARTFALNLVGFIITE